jgi:hypothetical protein
MRFAEVGERCASTWASSRQAIPMTKEAAAEIIWNFPWLCEWGVVQLLRKLPSYFACLITLLISTLVWTTQNHTMTSLNIHIFIVIIIRAGGDLPQLTLSCCKSAIVVANAS